MFEKRIQWTSSARSLPEAMSRTWMVFQSAPPSDNPYANSFASGEGCHCDSDSEPSLEITLGSMIIAGGASAAARMKTGACFCSPVLRA